MAAALETAKSADFSATASLRGDSPYATAAGRSSTATCGVRPPLNGALSSMTLTGTPRDSGVTYAYQTGPYTSKTGLPPLAYKPWLTEYIDEYREPRDVKSALASMTQHYGTGDALRTGRYQHQGYPPSTQLLESSLTRRRQNAPNYESRVTAF